VPNLLSSHDLDRATIDALMLTADGLASGGKPARLEGAVMALAFFEPSLRTRIGFEVAALRLGAATVAVAEPRYTPTMSRAESLQDEIRVLGDYCDAICVRHPDSVALREAAESVEAPIINCGSGTSEHPTQALIDVFAIYRILGTVDGLRIAIIGDLQHMRAAHSLLITLTCFANVTVRCISPPSLSMPPELVAHFSTGPSRRIEESSNLDLDGVDIVYVAGMPRQAGSSSLDPHLRADFSLTLERALRLDEHVRILCPLPRIDEIEPRVDELPSAAYLQQSALGLPMRMAVLQYVLNRPWPILP
jgi:aspartate carbamoyltransferase catalytic subunit